MPTTRYPGVYVAIDATADAHLADMLRGVDDHRLYHEAADRLGVHLLITSDGARADDWTDRNDERPPDTGDWSAWQAVHDEADAAVCVDRSVLATLCDDLGVSRDAEPMDMAEQIADHPDYPAWLAAHGIHPAEAHYVATFAWWWAR